MPTLFDPHDHQIRQLIITAGKVIRKAKGLPEEKNVNKLYYETALLLGMVPKPLTTATINHLPMPHEMIDTRTGKPVMPKRDCPACGKKQTLNLHPLCKGCKDSDQGEFKTMWLCPDCGFKEKSKKFFAQWMDELGIDLQGLKQHLGIKTITDEGLK